jgi:hypothetical protein
VQESWLAARYGRGVYETCIRVFHFL